MTISFIDSTGKPRPASEIELALQWAKKKIVRPDYKDPEGIIMCVTIKDALEELLTIRAFLDKAKADPGQNK